jgi:hypothetical protein
MKIVPVLRSNVERERVSQPHRPVDTRGRSEATSPLAVKRLTRLCVVGDVAV